MGAEFCEYCGGNDDSPERTGHPRDHTMDCERPFKVLRLFGREHASRPQVESVPWSFVVYHEEQAKANHSQTLKRLNERGGLSPLELYAVVHDMKFSQAAQTTSEAQAREWLTTKPWETDDE